MNDVCIVGGGPAGLAASIALRSNGFSVTVMDARRPPIDKACGEGLLPGGLAVLRELGIPTAGLTGFPLTGIRFFGDGNSVGAPFPHGQGLGVRRTRLHEALVARAESLGVELRWNSPVADFSELGHRWIIGADGIQSRVRKWAKLDSTSRDSARLGFQRHYRMAPWSSEVEVYWGLSGQAYVTPVAEDEIGVAVLTRRKTARFHHIVAEFPALQQRLATAEASPVRGGITATRTLRTVARSATALIGDASGSVDAITGEGLALSFRQALLLASSLESGDLTTYQRQHHLLSRRTRLMGDLMMLLDRSGILRRRALRVLSDRPRLFARLVEMHTTEVTIPELLAGCANLGWQLATASLFPGS
ncbi:MAG: monooxygenase, FAD-binding [Bryobacterales bacterium]|nr:monooxygenase, FAD-binding [Bryobacterales bacterium]